MRIPTYLKDTETVGIIGTAGRGADKNKLDIHTYNKMYDTALEIIGHNTDNLISGGAAWADHIAVKIFLDYYTLKVFPYHHLTLELPCSFSDGKYDEGIHHNGVDIGKTANYYHELFSHKINDSTLYQITHAIQLGATINIGQGFFDRNSQIAKADKLIAFTYGDNEKIKDGGTSDTAKKYIESGGTELFHVNLNNFKIYKLDYFPE